VSIIEATLRDLFPFRRLLLFKEDFRMSNAKAINEQNFAQETGSGVTLVDFWAEWCGPCRMMGPVIDQVAAEYAGKALVAKVDVDECQNIAVTLGVNSIPTLIVFKDGVEVKRFVGVTGKGDLAKALDAAIA